MDIFQVFNLDYLWGRDPNLRYSTTLSQKNRLIPSNYREFPKIFSQLILGQFPQIFQSGRKISKKSDGLGLREKKLECFKTSWHCPCLIILLQTVYCFTKNNTSNNRLSKNYSLICLVYYLFSLQCDDFVEKVPVITAW